ncbi:NAD(P)/FAD-dependent oxidoreductase [Alicyclobacillus acidiphilus]|uniref:NAD(P)/FAD-dependent oxidoreductase n=1 Tax=Alicyclobacillus acidiphilus TaxID=182455 RepID=UPI001FDFF218|nr:NAD(P)/FAD-dependent oxidoreductase [Alicyclobacillus acidiphilus]
MQTEHSIQKAYDVAVVGAGASGIGLGVVLAQLDVRNFVVLERETIGSSFQKWPQEMRLITPSFPGQGFGALDLNAIVPDSSPGYTFAREHLSGEEYAEYLQAIAEHFAVPVAEYTDVTCVEKQGEFFVLQTSNGTVRCRYLVWAAGEFQYPQDASFEGGEHCLHSSRVRSWAELEGDSFLVIGGNESGMDAAYQLVCMGKQVKIVTAGKNQLAEDDDAVDPSLTLSPFTYQRMEEVMQTGRLSITANCSVVRVEKHTDGYVVHLANGEVLLQPTRPICATGFAGGLSVIAEHFDWLSDGSVDLSLKDESTKSEGLFVVGPNVRHGDVILCFIYKFRQRFAVIAEEIAHRLGVSINDAVIEYYRANNMYLDDLSCCEVKCEC